MRTPPYLILVLLLAIAQATLTVGAQPRETGYGAIVVRGDVYADWTLAASYGVKAGAPVVTLLPGVNEQEVVSLLAGLTAYEERPRILVVGDRLAVPEEFVRRMRSLGVSVDRIGGPTRADTAINLVTQLWIDCEKIVVVNGSDTRMYMPALLLSRELDGPILFSSSGKLPSAFWGALSTHLTRLKEVYELDGSLMDAEVGALEGRGVKVVRVEPEAAGIQAPGGWWGGIGGALGAALTPHLYIGILAGGVVGYLAAARRAAGRAREEILAILMPDERVVVEMVLESGELTQDTLPERTGFSKAKISKLVQDLVDRGLVVRERRGRTYLLRPAKIFKAA